MMHRFAMAIILTALCMLLTVHAAEADRPRILVLGDSISKGYFNHVREALADRVDVIKPEDNCRHTAYTLEHLDQWLGEDRWDLITWNNGLWDLRLLKAGDPPKHQIELPAYRANLRQIAERLQRQSDRVLFVSTTPVRWEDEVQVKKRRNVDNGSILLKKSGRELAGGPPMRSAVTIMLLITASMLQAEQTTR